MSKAILIGLLVVVLVVIVGLITMCLMKSSSYAPASAAPLPGATPKKVRMLAKGNVSDVSVRDLPTIFNKMSPGDSIALIVHMATCGHCQRFLSQVVRPHGGEFPMNVYLLEMNQTSHAEAQATPSVGELLREARGVPTTLKISKDQSGALHYAASVGFMDHAALLAALRRTGGQKKLHQQL